MQIFYKGSKNLRKCPDTSVDRFLIISATQKQMSQLHFLYTFWKDRIFLIYENDFRRISSLSLEAFDLKITL